MVKWLHRNRFEIFSILLFIILLLIGILIFKNHESNKSHYKEYKELFDILSSIVSILLISIGAILSYFKFFKGRLFQENIELVVFAKVVEKDEKYNSVFCNIKVNNIGNIAIINPKSYMKVEALSDDLENGKKNEEKEIELNEEYSSQSKKWIIIEPKAHYNVHSFHKFDKSIWAFKYTFHLISDRGNSWVRVVTIPNKDGYEYQQD
ncbi:hypothetical protein [Neolewinella persica]|uniref:hypothetical protein n=1 Tax=Neolewinella persica TaxID=70998 RepID=UPI00036A8159|nr:hypothetical protein [Neolewinella persica]